MHTLPESRRYTFNFNGNARALDHALVNAALAHDSQFEVVHVHSEFADSPSDHDPIIARIKV